MKAFSFFVFMFIGTSLWISTMGGGGGLSTTALNGNITATTTSIQVTSTAQFQSKGVVWVNNEQVYYASKDATHLNGAVRGYNNTDATAHSTGEVVRAEDNGVLNSVFGFDVGKIVDSWGVISFPIIFVRFFTTTLPHMLMGNMGSLFAGNGIAIIFDIWLVFGAGFIYSIIMVLINSRRQWWS